jgi:hypothetical protein
MSIRLLSGLNVDSNTLVVDEVNNRVGIGGASPSVSLDVAGSINIKSTFDLTWGGPYGPGIPTISGSVVSSVLAFYPAGSTSGATMYINASGNVGINTTSPSEKLHVDGNVRVTGKYYDSSNSEGTSGQVLTSTGAGTAWVSGGGGISGSGTTNYVTKWTGSSAVGDSSIYDNGNVGIGTTAPTQKLQVDGNVYVNDDGATGNGIMLRGADRPLIARGWDLFTSGNKLGVGRWGVYMESGELFIGAPGTDYGNALITLGGWLVNGTREPNLTLNNSTQRVGIGTTAPTCKLTVDSSTGFSWGFPSTAAVKVGTPGTGGSLLVMTPSLNSTYESGFAIDGTYLSGKTVVNINAFGVYSGGGYSADLVFKTSTDTTLSEKMRITSAGNVGIGTTAPGSSLTVGTSFATIPGITVDTGNTGNSAFVARKTSSKPAFGILPWDSEVLLSAGVYYDGSTWIHHSNSNDNLLFVLDPGGGARWYASNDGTPNWNVVADEQLWDSSAIWTNLVRSTRSGNSYFTGGNVGIGTTAPAYKLDVTSDIRIGEGLRMVPNAGAIYAVDGTLSYYSSSNGVYLNGAGTNGWLRLNASGLENDINSINIYGQGAGGYIDVNTGASTRIRVTNGGNVGIGTTSPAYTLDVSGTAKASAGFTVGTSGTYKITTNADATLGYLIRAGSWKGTAENTLALAAETGFGISLFTNGSATERMVIDTSGNVGIGTTAPADLLHLDGKSNYPFLRFAASQQTTARYFKIGMTDAVTHTIEAFGPSTLINFLTSGSERMRITSAGNVGIGTTSPIGKLQIAGTSGNLLTVGTLTNNWAGDVAIGVTNGNGVIISKVNTANDTNRVLVFYRDDTNGATIFGYTPSGGSADVGFQIRANAASYFNGGNVGIGTTSPGAKLDVAGQIRSYAATGQIYSYSTVSSNTAIVYAGWTSGTGMQMGYLPDTAQGYIENTYPITSGQVFGDIYFRQNSAGTMVTRMTIKADGGNVGIGTTAPSAKLDVRGQTYINNGTSNALFIDTTVADNNTRDAIYLFEDDSAASGRQAISWYNGNQLYYKARLWTEVGGGYSSTTFGIDVADNSRTVATRLVINNGNVGIGTTAPGNLLHVAGQPRFDSVGGAPADISAPVTQNKYYGTNSVVLTSPDTWLKVSINGTDYVIPAYAG